MNREKMLELADFIEKEVKELEDEANPIKDKKMYFCMEDFIYHEKDINTNYCGTVACIAGSYAMMDAKKLKIPIEQLDTNKIDIEYKARMGLDINYYAAMELFSMQSIERVALEDVMKKHAIFVLRYLADLNVEVIAENVIEAWELSFKKYGVARVA